jgi:hypothetical protein
LDPLCFVQATRTWQEGLEPIGVFLHGAGPPALRQLKQGSRSEWRAKSQVEEVLEVPPCRCALVLLELDVPELRDVLQMVRGHPHPLLGHGALLTEVRKYESHLLRKAIGSDLPS